MTTIRNPYNYSTREASIASGLACSDPTRTQQHSKEEADINTIVRRFGITGTLPGAVRPPSYRDFDLVLDFQTAQNALLDAQANFMKLPSALRARFENSPQQFLEFCSLESNLPEMRKLGLAVAETPSPAAPAAS